VAQTSLGEGDRFDDHVAVGDGRGVGRKLAEDRRGALMVLVVPVKQRDQGRRVDEDRQLSYASSR
jgi:hypothetical protein